MTSDHSLIVLHSLFRSGSTYFFHVFRRAHGADGSALYTTFQEPVHEAVFLSKDDPTSLSYFSGTGEIAKTLRHPEIGASYFQEIIDSAADWRGLIRAEMIYDGFFGATAVKETAAYLNALAGSAVRRPVIQECRTPLRIGPLKNAGLDGTHVALWRNPWDQWWSFKATDYFDTALRVALSAPNPPPPIARLRKAIALPDPGDRSIMERFAFFEQRRPTAEESYSAFFMLWMLAIDEARRCADFDINIDRLTHDESYRHSVLEAFAARGATGLDFSDAKAPRFEFTKDDAGFFSPIELKVRAMLMESGFDEDRLGNIDAMRVAAMPMQPPIDAGRPLRAVVRRIEGREAQTVQALIATRDAHEHRARHFEAEFNKAHQTLRDQSAGFAPALEAAVAAVRAEAADNRMRLDARLAAAEAERAEASAASEALRAQNALIDAERARLAALSAQASAEIASLRDLSAKAEQERLALAETNSHLTLALDQAAAKAERERRRANELDWEAKRASLHAQHVEARVAALLDSGSWKATAPLRAAGMLARNVSAASRAMTKQAARTVLSGGLGLLRTAPGLKRALHDIAVKSPFGEPFLRFARARPQAVPAPPSPPRAMLLSSQLEDRSSQAVRRRVLYYYVDHTIACPVNTGMQRVVRGLAVGLLAQGAPLVFVKWSRTSKRLVLITRAELRHLGEWSGPRTDAGAYPDDDTEIAAPAHHPRDDAWLIVPEVAYINTHRDEPTLDVIMAARQAKLKTAFVFYDAIPLRRPEFASSATQHETYMRALLLADFVAPISRWSAVDLASYLTHHELADLSQGPAIKPLLLPGESSVVTGRGNSAKAEKLILCVGTIEERKNQGALLEAFEKFAAGSSGAGWRLELVGNLHPRMAEQVNAAAARNAQIRYRGNLSDAELAGLYDACAFTVFPSVEEGFGLPIVESLSHGKPCICASFGAMAEVAAGGGCLMVDVRDPDAIAAAIETLATDTRARADLSAEAIARPATTWTDYAQAFASQLAQMDSPLSRIGRIFYFVDQTAKFESNTGIQRVVRGLARALIETGAELVPVCWDMALRDFARPGEDDLAHLEKWNGPKPDAWRPFRLLDAARPGDWLVIPEVLSSPAGPAISDVHEQARARGLRIAWVFYDAIPYKMRDLYPPQATDAHAAYMRAIARADLVLPISKHTASDLIDFIRCDGGRAPALFERIRPVLLPGELRESQRVEAVKENTGREILILSVGTVEPRKNHLTLIHAFKLAKAQSKYGDRLRLTIVGGDPFAALGEALEVAIAGDPAIKWIKKSADDRLRTLYEECVFTVYPSLEEGFGLPILESLWHARPCICRNSGAMLEVASGGGCVLTETASASDLAAAIVSLADDGDLRAQLTQQAVSRTFSTWRDYADEVAVEMAQSPGAAALRGLPTTIQADEFYNTFANLSPRPLLSICITTYNRAPWLDVAMRNLLHIMPAPNDAIEIVIVDNTSTDNTPDIAQRHLHRPDVRFYRNAANVGMLGNLRVTAHHARGKYIWIIGDDDLAAPEAPETILTTIGQHQDAELIYLNYSYTREDDANAITDFDAFFASGIPISQPTPDKAAPIAAISAMNENLFTAIYCLVFRRDHALRAYSQDTSGAPFSTMLTCIPTTSYVLNEMMNRKGVWLGTPQLVVNMNVSWLKYAPIWILERVPEALDLAERMGAPVEDLDKIRSAHLPGVAHWFDQILKDDPAGNRKHFDPCRTFARFQHLSEFQVIAPSLVEQYANARREIPKDFPVPSDRLIPSLTLSQ